VITSSLWRGKRYAVLGLARSGRATVEALLASGAEVVAWDANEEARNGIEGVNFADPLTLDLTGFTAVIVSPGVPLNRHPIAAHAAKFDVPVIGDIELFSQARAELPPHKVVGITGTNGKSTTTALVHHILKTAGVPTTMGGNIGLPILGQEPLPEGGVYVLELSSFQIDLTFTLDCDVAVLLNITPDHLDRYASFEAYAAAKFRLVTMQSDEHAWVATDDAIVAQLDRDAEDLVGPDGGDRAFTATSTNSQGLVSVFDGVATTRAGRIGFQRNWPSLHGPHNAQNAACAIAVGRLLDLELNEISEGLRTYPGLPHRMERIGEKDGVLYVNDSKATNPTSTAPALAAYPVIHWILGGQAKTNELDACVPHLSHVKTAFTIGRDSAMLASILRNHGVAVSQSVTLDQAVWRASVTAKPGETVLLSPACASFDQFRDYEDRGDQFRALVGAL
jgi:UDP-N-acetylmuramoylalanine--D-glutamate ligase